MYQSMNLKVEFNNVVNALVDCTNNEEPSIGSIVTVFIIFATHWNVVQGLKLTACVS